MCIILIRKEGEYVMEMNKVLKNISVILECSFIGSVILYVYNFYTASKKYEILPVAVKTRLNIFVLLLLYQ